MCFVTYLILAILLSSQSLNVLSKRVATTTPSAFTFNAFNSSTINFDYDHEISNLEISGDGDIESENEDYHGHRNHHSHEDTHDNEDHEDREEPEDNYDHDDRRVPIEDNNEEDRPDDLIIENVSLSPRSVV